jgi:gliding motility-associated-like protein
MNTFVLIKIIKAMKKNLFYILIIFFLLTNISALRSQTTLPIVAKNFTDVQNGFQKVGVAYFTPEKLRLTKSTNNSFGCGWWKERLNLGTLVDFSAYFSFQITGNSSVGADGIGFVLQTTSSGAGSTGEGIGYQGISPSIIIEFDTYNNSAYDQNGNHIAIMEDGNNQNHKTQTSPGQSMKNGSVYHVWVDYDGTTLEVRFSNTSSRPGSATLSHTVSLASKFAGKNVFVGFTSATGGEYSTHDITSFLFSDKYISGGLDPNGNYIPGPNSISVTTNPAVIYLTETSNVTATAKLPNGNPAANADITFSCPCGTFNPVTVKSDANGIASTTFTGVSVGNCTITANCAGLDATTPIEIKAVPAPVATPATGITSSAFDANWNAANLAIKYYFDAATDYGFTNILTGYNDLDVGNVLTTNVNGVSPQNTVYFYRVRASNGTAISENSNIIAVIPTPVAIAGSNILNTSFDANWDPINGVSSYVIDISENDSFSTFLPGFNNTDIGNVTSSNITGLTVGTTYYYRVRAVVPNGQSENSNVISVTVGIPVAIDPTNITATTFEANWNPFPGSEKFYLDVATDMNFTDILADYNNKDVGNVNTFKATGMTPATFYYYRVRVKTATFTSLSSNVIEVYPVPLAPVATPATHIKDKTFTAHWKEANTATGYVIDISSTKDFANILDFYDDYNIGNVLSEDVTGADLRNTSYYYRVRAYNKSGQSPNSNIISVTPEDIIIGNLLTPNGDGKNDVWRIPHYDIFENANITVYDSYSQELFNSIGYHDTWDGTHKGKEMQSGEYYYLIKYNANGIDKILKGVILLLR